MLIRLNWANGDSHPCGIFLAGNQLNDPFVHSAVVTCPLYLIPRTTEYHHNHFCLLSLASRPTHANKPNHTKPSNVCSKDSVKMCGIVWNCDSVWFPAVVKYIWHFYVQYWIMARSKFDLVIKIWMTQIAGPIFEEFFHEVLLYFSLFLDIIHLFHRTIHFGDNKGK